MRFAKKTLALLLTAVLVLGMVPITAPEVRAAENLQFSDFDDLGSLGRLYNLLGDKPFNQNALSDYSIFKSDITEADLQRLRATGETLATNEGSYTYVKKLSSYMDQYASSAKLSFGLDVEAGFKVASLEMGLKCSVEGSNSSRIEASDDYEYAIYEWMALRERRSLDLTSRRYIQRVWDNSMLDEDFLADVNDLSPAAFFKKYGTHIITSYAAGGESYVTLASEAFSSLTETSSEMKENVEVSVGGKYNDVGATAEVAMENSSSEIHELANSSETAGYNFVQSGSTTLTSLTQEQIRTGALDFSDWANGITEKSSVILLNDHLNLLPVWELLIDSAYTEKAAALKAYYNENINGDYVELYDTYIASNVSVAPDHTVYYKGKTGHTFPVPYTSNMTVGQGSTFNAVDLDTDMSKVNFTVTPASAATVDEHGTVTVGSSVANGTVITVKVYTNNGTYKTSRSFTVQQEGVGSLFAGGYGTPERPYLISLASHIVNMNGSSDYLKKEFRLISDIDMNGTSFAGLSSFSGVLDGNGHKIKNWIYRGSATDVSEKNLGFVNVNEGGTIKNCTFADCSVEYTLGNSNYGKVLNIGTVCGINKGTIENVVVFSCWIWGTSGSKSDSNENTYRSRAGGIAGLSYGEVKKCGVMWSDVYSVAQIGDACSGHGWPWNSDWGTGVADSYAGGLIGIAETTATTSDCYSYCNNLCSSSQGPDSPASDCSFPGCDGLYSYCGGLLGRAIGGDSTVITCVSAGNTYDAQGDPDQIATDKIAESASGSNCFSASYTDSALNALTLNSNWTYNSNITRRIAQNSYLRIDSQNAKTAYYKGEQLNLDGVVIYAIKDDAASTPEQITRGYTVSGYDPSKAGTQTVTVTYGKNASGADVKGTFQVTVKEPELVNISVCALPEKTEYIVGDSLDTTGLTLSLTYSDGSCKTVTGGYTVSGYDSAVAERQNPTVSYGGLTTGFAVNVSVLELTGMSIATLPKTEYFVGEALNTSGLTLLLTYDDGSTKTVSDGFTVSGFSSAATGTKTLTVTYENYSATYDITVSTVAPTKLSVKTRPTRTAYYVGDTLNTAGLTLTLAYNNGTTKTISSGYTVSGFDSATAGTKTVTVSYSGFTATFTVTVYAVQETGITIATLPTKTAYYLGESLNTTGLKLTVSYNNGTTKTVTSGFTVTGLDTSVRGTQTLTVHYNGCTATYTVTVTGKWDVAVLTQPTDQLCEVGTTVKFKVSASNAASYQWQYRRSASADWSATNLTGYNTNTLSVEATLARDGYQYRCVITGTQGDEVITDVATLTIDMDLVISAQPESVLTAAGANTKFTVEATGKNLSYQWQYRRSATASWINTTMTGYNTDTLTVAATAARNGYQYQCVITDSDGVTVNTDPATLTVLQVTTQPASQSAEKDTYVVFRVAATAADDLSYQWQYRRSTSGSWTDTSAIGCDTVNLLIQATTARSGYQYRCAITAPDGSVCYSDPATLTVQAIAATAAIATQPVDQSAKVGDTVMFDVKATGAASYQWQYRRNASSSSWTNTTMDGYSTNVLQVGATAARNGYQYRCIITGVDGTTLTTDAATLTVGTATVEPEEPTEPETPSGPAAITSQPASKTAQAGETVQFSIAAQGEVVSYKWEYRKIYKWFNTSMEGYNTDTLTVTATGARNGYDYRCLVTFADGTEVYSDPAKLTVTTYITNVSDPNDQTVVLGYKGQFTASADGEGIKYQWQYKRPGSELWIDTAMEGCTKPTVMIETTTARDSYQYRCEITDITGNVVYTEAATMRVLSFTSHPVEAFASVGANVRYTVTTSVADGFTYQWQYSANGGEKWSNTTMTGYNTATLTVAATAARNNYLYRCVLTGSKNSKIESNAAILHVSEPVEITAQPKSVTSAVNTNAVFTVEATNAYAYQWQYRKSETGSWINTTAEGNQTATVTVPITSNKNGYQYRCQVTGLNGVEYYTDAVTLIVGTAAVEPEEPTEPEDSAASVTVTSQPTTQTALQGGTVKFTVRTENAASYQWQYRRSTSGSWTNTTMEGYKTDTLTVEATAARNGYQYRCVVTGFDGTVLNTNAATLTTLSFTKEPTDQRGTTGGNAFFSVALSSKGAVTYQWQYSRNSGTSWSSTTMDGYNTDTLTVAVTSGRSGYQYRCVVTDEHKNTMISDAGTLYYVSITDQPDDKTVAAGKNAVFTVTLSDKTDVTFQWQYRKSTTGSWINTNMTGYNTTSLTVAATSGRNGYQYRCIITMPDGTELISDPATLTVG